MIKKELIKCPDCGGEVKYYHSSITHGSGLTRVICAKHCQGWKVIKEIDRNIPHPVGLTSSFCGL